MNIFTTLLSIILLSALLFVGQNGTNSVPPLGKLLNPATGFWQNSEPVKQEQSQEFLSLNINATTYIDDQMIPIFTAEKYNDALFAQGYFHAKMRLWQMDFITRVSAGRLSEILGTRAVNFDKLQRRRGLYIAAKDAANSLNNYPKTKASFEAYVEGVNAYIDQLNPSDYPIEYKVLNYVPEKWSLEKCGLILKYMAYMLAGRERDIPRTNSLNYFGQELFDHIYSTYDKLQSPIISNGQTYDYIDSILPLEERIDTMINHFIKNPLITQPDKDNGSNNWAVNGKKTKSGDPILCNDPHLTLGLPSIWIQNQILADDIHVHGVSIPGVPGIVIGFNDNIAWGVTNGGHDVMDWYEIDWVNDTKNHYWLDGKKERVKTRVETIKVKNQPNIHDTVHSTYWGPIVYQSTQDDYFDLAMRWVVLDSTSSDELGAFLNLNKAKNYDEYRDAISSFKTPLQNSVYADKKGNIAMTLQGRILHKQKEQGRFVQNGNDRRNDWQGYIPVKHNPKEKNPSRNFVSSANQISTDSSYPYHYVSGDFRSYRGRILNRLLIQENNFDINKMKKLQQSSFNIKAEDVVPSIVSIGQKMRLKSKAKNIIQDFDNWDYTYLRDQSTPFKFEIFWRSLYHNIWDEIYNLKDSITLHKPTGWRTIELINESPEDPIFDIIKTEKKETLADIITIALEETIHQLDSLNIDNWGEYKNTHIDHLLKLKGFNRTKIMSGGIRTALNAIKETHGPSWRIIVEMGDTINAYGIFPGGQSGNPGSPYYDNTIDDWAEGVYPKIHFTRNLDEIKKRAQFVIEMGKDN